MRTALLIALLTILAGTAAMNRMLAQPVPAPKRVDVTRSDGHATSLLIYQAAGTISDCAPLAVISHGAGGSEKGYRYLGVAMSQLGYTAVVMGHQESGFAALRADVAEHGIAGGLAALVSDPKAEQARLLDIGAALKWADTQCKSPFRVLLGHSMGAETVMLEAGAKNVLGIDPPEGGRDRFDAYVAMSPEGPGIVFPEHAWAGIGKPMLVLTGTRDRSLQGGAKARQVAWSDLPGSPSKCQWIGVVDGATHMNFAGVGLGADRVKPLITQTIASFLDGVHNASCSLPEPQSGMTLRAK